MTDLPYDFKKLERNFHPRKDLTLKFILAFLEEIGSPHKDLPPTIHVAGTNGKGSSVAMLRSIYEAQGYKVHVITSPHLHCISERLVLGSTPISLKNFGAAFALYEDLAKKHQLSWYEFIIGVSLKLCATTPADVLLLEVGLGGEFDATNIITNPMLSLITPISIDHTHYLGSTLRQIAQAKGGIIKKGCPILTAPQDPDVTKVLKDIAKACESPFHSPILDLENTPQPNLHGAHQLENAALIIEATTLLQDQLPVSQQAINTGLQTIKWPGRLEKVSASNGCTIWFDVAHNAASTKATAEFFKGTPTPKALIFALLKNKDALETMLPLVNTFEHIFFFAPPDAERYHSPESLKKTAAPFHKNIHILRNLKAAVKRAMDLDIKTILIAGSHYLATEIQSSDEAQEAEKSPDGSELPYTSPSAL